MRVDDFNGYSLSIAFLKDIHEENLLLDVADV